MNIQKLYACIYALHVHKLEYKLLQCYLWHAQCFNTLLPFKTKYFTFSNDSFNYMAEESCGYKQTDKYAPTIRCKCQTKLIYHSGKCI